MATDRQRSASLVFLAACVAGPFPEIIACGGDDSPTPTCVDARIGAIYGGLPSADEEGVAIGAFEKSDGTVECTGTFVARDWVITASHCQVCDRAMTRFRLAGQGQWSACKSRSVHPQLDVALVQVTTDREEIDILPLAKERDAAVLGDVVTLAGLGQTDQLQQGELRFVDEPIVRVTQTEIWVDGQGMRGACVGDSGGPMLKRNRDGVFEVLGILSRGSADCLGTDAYVRADVLLPWLEGVVPRKQDGCVR